METEPALDQALNEYELAKIEIRMLAFFIDSIVFGIYTIPYFYFFGESDSDGTLTLSGWPAFVIFLSYIAYIPVCEGFFGKTLGKKILKLKVISDSFGQATLGQTFARFFMGAIDYNCLFVGLFIAITNPKNKRLGDMVAKTLVVNDNKH